MLEYFTYKKVKKHREEQAASRQQEKGKQVVRNDVPDVNLGSNTTAPGGSADGMPVLDNEDEEFLERLTSSDRADEDDDIPPPLPPRIRTPVVEIESDSSSMSSQKKGDKVVDPPPPAAKPRFAFVKALPRSISLRKKPTTPNHHLSVPEGTTKNNNNKKEEDKTLSRVLDDLDLASRGTRAISLSAESASLAHTFTQILRDLVNGVPTAYGDLTRLLDDSDGLLTKNYARLPGSLKKLVAQLPEKLTSTLAPELLAVSAGANAAPSRSFLSPGSLRELVSKPGALVRLLKGIMNALKVRFPAFVGTNVLWSLAVFLLLFMLWYCYKRGREERLEREARERGGEVGESSLKGAEEGERMRAGGR